MLSERGLPIDILRVDHAALAVRSLAEATELYRSLGFVVDGEVEQVAGQGVELQFMRSPRGDLLELLAATDPDTPVGRFLERRGPGLHHLALQVPSIQDALQRLDSAGFRLIDREPRPGARGHRVAFLHPKSTGGALIELVEHGGESPSRGTGAPKGEQ